MKSLLFWLASAVLTPALANPLTDLRWQHRPLLVFAPSHEAAPYQALTQYLMDRQAALLERDMVVLHLFPTAGRLDDQPLAGEDVAALRRHFAVADAEFRAVLVGKDGGQKGRWSEADILDQVFALIDTMPMRRREMRSNAHSP
ncbi:MAG: DUF4174 domain-containing protein [Candidatus Competibacterales bacterium]